MNAFFTISAVVTVFGLFLASYTDLKERVVPNNLNYSLLVLGFILHVGESLAESSPSPILYSILGALIAFMFSLVLYKLGAWAGGDVKLFTALGALLPVAPMELVSSTRVSSVFAHYPIFLFLTLENSVVIAFPFIMFYVFWKTFRNKKLRKRFKTMVKNTLVKSVCISSSAFGILVILSLAGFPNWVSIFPLLLLALLPQKIFYVISGFLLVAGFILSESWIVLISLFVASVFGFGFFEVVTHGVEALQRRIPVKKLEEGMILAELVVLENGKVKKMRRSLLEKLRFLEPPGTIISDMSATGLTKEDIQKLKNLGVKSILVKESVPLIPILLLGCIVSLVVGDLVWLLTKSIPF